MGKKIKAIKKCRICGSEKISDVLTLGNIHVARFSEGTSNAVKAPLTLCWCNDCKYLQLRHNIDLDLVFYPEYGYESGVNPAMVRELGEIVKSIRKIVNLEKGDVWLDIASNDGTLLLQVKGDVLRVGFDPSKKVALMGAERLLNKFGSSGFNVFVDYFNEDIWKKSFPDKKAKVITAIAVFYSVQDPNDFLNGVKSILHDEGLFVVQQNYTPEMVKQLAFCNVVNEHVTYPTFTSFKSLVERHGFEVADVLINDINGGSFRVYLKHKGASIEIEGGKKRVQELLEKECNMGYMEKDVYEKFAERVNEKGRQVRNYLFHQVKDGKKVYGLAASTRGNTRLQVWNLGPDLISGIAERNPRKIGKKTLGIPIVSDDEALKNADILFVSIWFYGDSVIEQYQEFLNKGGKMLFPSSSSGEPFLVEMGAGKIIKSTLPLHD
jgi:ubiquinone/menaquinone biosynthesis C-methylase UbiE/ribosomal protein L32